MANGVKKDFSKTSGGGDHFISFLSKELIPHIDATYRTNSYRMLVGHSLGGLIALNILLKYPNMFNAYIAIDPSLWWDNRILIKEEKGWLSKNNYSKTRLFLSMANTFPENLDTCSLEKDSSWYSVHGRVNQNIYISSKSK